jgi:hypothetical protein
MPEWSKVYTPEWVDKLYRGIQRNTMDLKIDFVCLTDREYDFEEDVHQIPLRNPEAGWGSLCEAWRPDLMLGRRCVLGLDTVIVGPIDEIMQTDCDIGLLRDPYAPDQIGNMVGIYDEYYSGNLWLLWLESEGLNDQQFLRKYVGTDRAVLLNDKYPGQILSYKVDIKGKAVAVPPVKIVYFHGNPKPNEIKDEWILEHWI